MIQKTSAIPGERQAMAMLQSRLSGVPIDKYMSGAGKMYTGNMGGGLKEIMEPLMSVFNRGSLTKDLPSLGKLDPAAKKAFLKVLQQVGVALRRTKP